MDCPICFETISKETGQVTTSCGHTFHFKCLNTWYWRQTQNEEGQESCPCCRKMPGEYEKASTVTGSEESDSISGWTNEEEEHEEQNEWIRIGPGRWVVPSSEPDRLRILAQVADDERKRQELYIPPYSAENHALWVLRNFFEEPSQPATQAEPIHILDRPKMLRKRTIDWGRTFWSRLGKDYDLDNISGYKSD